MNKLLSLSLSLLFSTNVIANPNKDVDYLMGTPVTLWDWGRFKIEQELNEIIHKEEDIYIDCSTLYHWDKDSLEIICTGERLGKKHLTLEEGEELKSEIIEKVRLHLGYYFPGNYNSYEHMRSKNSYLADSYPIEKYFQNRDFTLKSFPDSLGKSLEKITKIVTRIRDFENGGAYSCEAKLQGSMPMCNFMTVEDEAKSLTNRYRAIMLESQKK